MASFHILVRRLISWLANMYPNHVFYSRKWLMAAYDQADIINPETVIDLSDDAPLADVCCMLAARVAPVINDPGTTATISITGLSYDKKDIGNYRVQITKLPSEW